MWDLTFSIYYTYNFKKKKEKKTNCFEHLFFFYLDELKERERELR